MRWFPKKLIRSNQGQGIMEYMILTSLVGIFCLVAMSKFGQVIQKRIDYMKEKIVQEIKMDKK